MLKLNLAIITFYIVSTISALATEYHCIFEKSFYLGNPTSDEFLKKLKPSVQLKDNGKSAVVVRCFIGFTKKYNCEPFKIDHIVYDPNLKIKKYYEYLSQYDLQLFSNLTFLENTGRGNVNFGKC